MFISVVIEWFKCTNIRKYSKALEPDTLTDRTPRYTGQLFSVISWSGHLAELEGFDHSRGCPDKKGITVYIFWFRFLDTTRRSVTLDPP